MTTTTQSVLPILTASIEERLLAPLRRNALAARTWFISALAFVLLLHGAILAFLVHRDGTEPQQVAKETPIEVIVEPPRPEPKPPAQEKKPEPPKPEAKPEIEKPASSAPRAPSEEKIDTAALQKETHAPKAPTPPKDGKPEPKEEASSPSEEKAQPDKVEEKAESKPEVLEQDREALDRATPLPPRRPEEFKVAKLPPQAKTKHATTALDHLAGASSLPDYSFARPTKKSRVHGGNEDSRYLAIVFGMIMAHRPNVAGPGEGGSVTVAFNVEDSGQLVGLGVQRTSGYPELDAAAITAIRRAAPFPPLPPGAPHGLVATIDFSRAGPAYTMGSEDR